MYINIFLYYKSLYIVESSFIDGTFSITDISCDSLSEDSLTALQGSISALVSIHVHICSIIMIVHKMYTIYVDNFTRIIFQFTNVHVTLISRIIHVYGIHVYSGKDLDAFNFAKTCHREIKVTWKLSTYTAHMFMYCFDT